MEEGKSFSDVKIHNSFGKVERWQKGLSLLPKALWTSEKLHGEIIEVYNGGSTPITLSESWFAKQGSLAIKLKTPTLKAHEKTTLYRISEVSHG